MTPNLRNPFARSVPLLAGGAFALVVAGHQAGCSSSGGSPPSTSDSDRTGTIGLAVTLPGGTVLSNVNWQITGPSGASTIVQQGSFGVQSSATISFVVGGIAAGSGYAIALSATSVDGTASCSGSATFSVAARTTTNVSVLLQCRLAGPDAGSIAVVAQPFDCATIAGVSALPAETAVGGSVSLSATALGLDPKSLAYTWSAPSGTFSAPSAAATQFTCGTAGPVTITVAASDGPVPDGGSCDPAQASTTIQVQCTAAQGGGGGSADGGGSTTCALGANGAIKHVIYVQFDNTHLSRDNPNVPSDLEQMPHLLNFIRNNGTMMDNDHTVLISHTAAGFLSSFTGLYPDRTGQTVTNSYVRTSPTGAFTFPSSFAYWTDPAAAGTTIPNLVGPDGTNVPAPWVSFTRAGCNFGAVGGANLVLENTSTAATGDVTKVFGAGSPQATEANASAAAASGTAARQLALTDLEGIAVHCAQGSAVCASGEPDLLPQEPGGYAGFNGLFGAKQVDPVLTGQASTVPLTDLLGHPITDPFDQAGFPGFNGLEAAVSLAYTAALQEHGVNVTYAYISDAHDAHGTNGSAQAAFGPGQAGYVQQLQAYDQAFASFFARLATDGIDQTNTLFVFTVDEGDHFVGAAPTPANCDGVTIPCTYSAIGEVNANIDTLVSNQFPDLGSKFLAAGAPDAFTVHGDDAPPFYLARTNAAAGPTGPLGQTDPDTREFERDVARLTNVNPYTGNTDSLLFRMADQAGMKAIHMFTTGDLARNAQFVLFADDDYFITDFPSSTCLSCIQSTFAWNHGDDQSVIGATWQGYVGPGVKNLPDQTVFTDHTDVRPTMSAILGLHDRYQSDGRVISELLQPSVVPSGLAGNLTNVQALGAAYKQIEAPFGAFASCVLVASTAALQSDDATYTSIEASIVTLTAQRDAIGTAVRSALDGAEFAGAPIDSTQAQTWITQAEQLLSDCNDLAASVSASDGGAGNAGDGGVSDAGPNQSDASAVDTGATSSNDAGAAIDASTPATADIDVYRVGDGNASLAATGNPVFIDEFSPSGALVRSIPMPTAASGANHRLVAAGTSAAEGLVTSSSDGKFLLVTGYDIDIPAASSISTSTAARTIGRIDAEGTVDTSTALSDFANGASPRSVTSPDGVSLWVDGSAGGIRFTTLGATTSTQLSATVTNLRQANIFASQLFVTDASGSTVRLGAVGGGLPTTAGQVIANLPGFATSGGSPYGFFFADLDGTPGLDTLYVADDSASPPGGVTKYSLVGGSWTAVGTVGAPADAYRGLTGVVSGGTVTLYATRQGGSGATGGGQLVSIVDASGFNGSFSATPALLASAATNTAFRGVAFAPSN